MNPPLPSSRPVAARAPTSNPRPATGFGQPPPLVVRLERAQVTRQIVRRAFATSRRGYDHSWIGLLLFLAVLFAVTAAPLPAG